LRIVLVSNRLPIVVEKSDDGWITHQASGGLVTALVPALKRSGGTWIGWRGDANMEGEELDTLLSDFGRREGYKIATVPLGMEDYKRFYEGFCNQIIWPLFHDFQSRCNFNPEYWASSLKVEQVFADVVESHVQPDDLIWVQDYHLMGLGKVLLDRGVQNKLAFFLHIPFPPPDIFCKLPWRKDILDGLLHYEVIGLQTLRDLRNFSDCVKWLLPNVEQHHTPRKLRTISEGRASVAGVFPIGIDFKEFAGAAAAEDVTRRAKELRQTYAGRQLILGVDRLDYTKGIPYRLRSFERALERFPELRKKVVLLQLVVPSREMVPQYQDMKSEIELLVAQINGKYTVPDWVPIHHVFRRVERRELLAWYREADVALVTSLKDGMNLVAKEYCACQIDANGVLVLSEFAGASEQLGRWAVRVNPYDIECVAEAIQSAVTMTPAERRPWMEKLRRSIRQQDVYWWLSQFLKVCRTQLNDLSSEPLAHHAASGENS
jgi:alpha,alpha-trehalose-phosphate synthase [UDP-forming]